MHRGVRTPPQARLHPIALIEDRESIQFALMEVMNALLRNTIDLKRATLLLRALQIAVKNAGRSGFNTRASSMVTEIPNYADPAVDDIPAPPKEFTPPFEAALPPETRPSTYLPRQSYEEVAKSKAEMIANYYGYPTAEAYEAAKQAKAAKQTQPAAVKQAQTPEPTKPRVGADAPAHVGTAAPGCPGGPAVSVRSAVPPTPATNPEFKKPAAQTASRKPPMNVKPVRPGNPNLAANQRTLAARSLH
jgi:hypothetical protein